MVALMSMFGTAQLALLAFPDERPFFCLCSTRLAMEAHITAMPVLVSFTISNLMIGFQLNYSCTLLSTDSTAVAVWLGCSVEDPKLAQEMLPILFVPQMLFAGFFVTLPLMPKCLRWARHRSTLCPQSDSGERRFEDRGNLVELVDFESSLYHNLQARPANSQVRQGYL
jgi:hypothetical protein